MTWVPSLLLLVLVLPPIYPTGRPPNRFWVWHLRCALPGIGLTMLVMGIADGGVDDTVGGHHLPWETPEWMVWVVGVASVVLLLGTTVTALVGTAVRTVRAGRPERQQLLLLLTVVACWRSASSRPTNGSWNSPTGWSRSRSSSACCATGSSASRWCCAGPCSTSRSPCWSPSPSAA